MTQPAIVVLGVFVADAAYRAERLPRMGETILGDAFVLGPGGKGSNQAVAAGRAGGDVGLVTRIGDDPFGAMAGAVWRDAGVSDALVERSGDATGSAFIFLDRDTGENAIIVCPGAAEGIDGAFVEARAAAIGGARVFVTQLEQPMGAAMRALEIARAGGAATILNPAPAAALPDGMLALCDYVTPNETEAEALTGLSVTTEAEARAAAARLLEMGVARAAILTLGARGALYHAADGTSVVVPALPVARVVDTTGAGDAFNGAFATALAEGRDPVEAVRFGCAAAGLAVTRQGAAAGMPLRGEIEAALSG